MNISEYCQKVSETEEEIYLRRKPDVKIPFLSKIIIRIYYGVFTISTNTLHQELRIKGIKVLSQKSSGLRVCCLLPV